ncbi:LysR family transcriptional regulator [Sporomusa aerivorans]|uniref:LysR family transcriptional regulator n=1 Tax=Sporomusa aerivorans TaxID=204936 RepID=UPI00352B71F1
MHINLELYRIFYVTAKTGSISKAAKELFTSQPAVSQSIKLLEQKLGGQLFFRTSKGVSLTAEGEIFFRYIEQGYQLIQTAEHKFQEMLHLLTGQIRIGAGDTLSKYYLLPYLGQFNECHPQIQIHVTNQTTFEILDFLKSGKIDLGIINLPIERDAAVEITETQKIQDCFVAGRKFRHLSEAEISLTDLTKYPIMVLEKGGNSRTFLEKYWSANGLVLQPEFELGTIDLLIHFAKTGLGVSCVIKDFISEELQNGELYEIKVKEPIPKRSIGLVVLRDVPLSTAARKFVSLLTTGAKETQVNGR